MHQTRLQRFTSALKQFKKKVKRGQREYAGAFTVKKPDNPSQKPPLISDDCLINTHELRWGVEAIIGCVEKFS